MPFHFAVPDYDIEAFELTTADYHRLTGLPLPTAAKNLPPDFALPSSWDGASESPNYSVNGCPTRSSFNMQ